jgi:hypothetical protein
MVDGGITSVSSKDPVPHPISSTYPSALSPLLNLIEIDCQRDKGRKERRTYRSNSFFPQDLQSPMSSLHPQSMLSVFTPSHLH